MIDINIQLFLFIQSVLSININSPIKKVLVSINQSSFDYLIYFYYKFFDRAKTASIYELKSWRLRLQEFLIFLFFFNLIFIKNHAFVEVKNNLSEKLVTVEEEECGNLKVVIDVGELTWNINQKKRSDILQADRCTLCNQCCRREYFFN